MVHSFMHVWHYCIHCDVNMKLNVPDRCFNRLVWRIQCNAKKLWRSTEVCYHSAENNPLYVPSIDVNWPSHCSRPVCFQLLLDVTLYPNRVNICLTCICNLSAYHIACFPTKSTYAQELSYELVKRKHGYRTRINNVENYNKAMLLLPIYVFGRFTSSPLGSWRAAEYLVEIKLF